MKTSKLDSAAPVPPLLAGPRSEAKRARILETAMRHFAERGYHASRIEDIATELSIAKGSVFQHFGSKEGLFLVAYQKAVSSFSAYLDAPAARARARVLRDPALLARADRPLVRENWIPYRVALLGNYGTDLRAAAGDQPVPARAGPVRNRRVRPHGRRARRGPRPTSTRR